VRRGEFLALQLLQEPGHILFRPEIALTVRMVDGGGDIMHGPGLPALSTTSSYRSAVTGSILAKALV
jgi:hypothetical protein